MRAIIYEKYGSPEVLQLSDVPKPTPNEDEILINVKACSVSAGDCEVRRFEIHPLFWLPIRLYMGLFKPRIKILGQEISGIVEEVGKNVTKFKIGDEVFAATEMDMGAYAEYLCLAESGAIAIKPNSISFQEAAALPVGSLNTMFFLGNLDLTDRTRILINGAGGSIGTISLQLAKTFGSHVTAVDMGDKLDMLKSIGADEVIDFEKEDFTKNGKTYDIIFEVAGKKSFGECKNSLTSNGYFLSANPKISQMIKSIFKSKGESKKVVTGVAKNCSEDLEHIAELVAKNKIKPVIDKIFKPEEAVDSHRYVESGNKKGNVIIKWDN